MTILYSFQPNASSTAPPYPRRQWFWYQSPKLVVLGFDQLPVPKTPNRSLQPRRDAEEVSPTTLTKGLLFSFLLNQ